MKGVIIVGKQGSGKTLFLNKVIEKLFNDNYGELPKSSYDPSMLDEVYWQAEDWFIWGQSPYPSIVVIEECFDVDYEKLFKAINKVSERYGEPLPTIICTTQQEDANFPTQTLILRTSYDHKPF